MKSIFFPFKLSPEGDPPPGGGNPNPAPPLPNPQQAEIDRIVAENNDLRKKNKDFEGTLNTVKTELEGLKRTGLKTNGDWQKVAGEYEIEAKTWKEKHDKVIGAFTKTLRLGEVKAEALKKGLRPEAVADVNSMNFEDVEVIIDANNQFVVKGADRAAEGLTKIRPHWFKDATPPAFNPGGGGNPPAPKGKLTVEEAKAAYLKALPNRGKDPVGFNKAWEEYSQAVTAAKTASR